MIAPTTTIDRIIRIKEIVHLTGLSRSTIRRLEQSGDFPARRKLSAAAIGWQLSAVEEWISVGKDNV